MPRFGSRKRGRVRKWRSGGPLTGASANKEKEKELWKIEEREREKKRQREESWKRPRFFGCYLSLGRALWILHSHYYVITVKRGTAKPVLPFPHVRGARLSSLEARGWDSKLLEFAGCARLFSDPCHPCRSATATRKSIT